VEDLASLSAVQIAAWCVGVVIGAKDRTLLLKLIVFYWFCRKKWELPDLDSNQD
jgi:hypothetical protein